MGCLSLLLKFITLLLAFVYVILIMVAWADCSIIPGLGRSCTADYHGGEPQHGLYWMAVIFYSWIGIPAVVASIYFVVRGNRNMPKQ